MLAIPQIALPRTGVLPMLGPLTVADVTNGITSGDYPIRMQSNKLDGASARGYIFDTAVDFANAGAINFSFRNNGTDLLTVAKNLTTLTDQSILATGTTGATPVSGAGTRMMWIPSKAAFRAGLVAGTQWDDANIGARSAAFGAGNTVQQQNGFSAGQGNSVFQPASGLGSAVFGASNIVYSSNNLVSGAQNNVGHAGSASGQGINLVTGTFNNVGNSPASSASYNLVAGIFNQASGNSNLISGAFNNSGTATASTLCGQSLTISGANTVQYAVLLGNNITVATAGSNVVAPVAIGQAINNPGFSNAIVIGTGLAAGVNALTATAANQIIMGVGRTAATGPQFHINATGIGVFNVAPVARQTVAVAAAAYAAVGGGNVQVNDTFGGYTIGQIVQALKNYGWLT